ncbi:Acyl-CoA synthetase family member 2 [Blattella germanica]|nr:Acyl-CoA synthetase family member 2 [Blattella germanica]
MGKNLKMIGVLVSRSQITVSYSCLSGGFLKRRFSISTWNRAAAKPSYMHNPGSSPLSAITTGQLIDIAASQWGHKEALVSVHQGHRYTYKEMKERGDQLAAGLLSIGLKPGDRLGLWGPNSSEWYLTFMAAARAGLILVNINPAYQISELRYCLSKVGVKALIAPESFKTQKYHEMISNIAPEVKKCDPGNLQCEELPDLKSVIMISENNLPGSYLFDEIINKATPELLTEVQELQTYIQPDEGCNLQFTSGTTGKAKATLLSHHNTINNMLQFGKRLELFCMDHRICLQVPLFHCFGNVLGLLAGLCYGSTIVLPGPSAPVSKELIYQLKETFNLKRVAEGYGMTETSPISFASLPNDSVERMCTAVGYIMDHIEAKIVDEKGKVVPFGKPGELWIRGYNTIDQFILYEDGYGQIVGRIKDMIIRGGENIFPVEVEHFLEEHPEILEAQVVGVPDERMGEEMCACLRLEKGSTLTAKQIKDYCKGKIAHFKIPRYYKFLTEFPKTQSGKIQKFQLRNILLKEGINT